ncbi:IclR family transcriptional regulator [Sneathiella marina]|uniref:IclR family transcriptional regulator n=1 Tax=Sneathiella marina TaxID=2950108 RepID=A0ABY4W6C9_9PROT|nr:IclR family transcriptional regulator [Sneathiella marina]USG62484.1 IclR family transcriptional regulator [Sneathiella marina]
MKKDTTLQTVSRAVRVLRCFDGGSLDLSLKELTERMALNKVTVLRLARTLVMEGLLVHDSRTGLYRLSFGCIGLARKLVNRDGLFECALTYMEEVRQNTNETVCLIVREELDRVTTHSLPSFQQVRFVLEVGDRRPVYMGAAGQCLISELSESELETIFAQADDRPGQEYKAVSKAEALDRLALVRKRGWAIGRGEWSSEAAGAAAPIHGSDGTVRGAISVVMPITRAADEYMENCARTAKKAALQISKELSRQHQ